MADIHIIDSYIRKGIGTITVLYHVDHNNTVSKYTGGQVSKIDSRLTAIERTKLANGTLVEVEKVIPVNTNRNILAVRNKIRKEWAIIQATVQNEYNKKYAFIGKTLTRL